MDKLKVIFFMIFKAELKIIFNKCRFKIPYLGYIITWYGIKPVPNKLHGIMGNNRISTTTEARFLLGMVQRNMSNQRNFL